ncbi:hypothetical protein [Sulfurimonas marina]|uniref:Uncharacterized protein n=1 Tax=Sulfurimonas marina TaxID=2590551 RepID=A0A7M1AYC0_9BACT|nr:hypothetical protein [Sulfurimonas marina]QOP41392.1 hypothetical protein FJR03_06395 [Sulfurimonas marina]
MMFEKECPCCDYQYNIWNYHLHTQMLPEEDSNYKSLHCLECNHKIQKEETVTFHYLKVLITFIGSIIFAYSVREVFGLWEDIDMFEINIPFMILFYILVYIYSYTFSSLECYTEKTKVLEDSSEQGGNINGIFGQKEKEIASKSKNVIFWMGTVVVLLILFIVLGISSIK